MQSTEALKQDRELLSRQIEAIDRALDVLGSTPNGSTRHRRRWTKAQREKMAASARKMWKARKAAKKGGEPK